jgi:hypothetical protein
MAAADKVASPASYGSGTPSRAQIGGAMKSILAKHAPQSSPWAPTRALQEMQTGGRMRSANAAKCHSEFWRKPSHWFSPPPLRGRDREGGRN